MAEGGGGGKTLVIVLVVLLLGGVCVCGGGAAAGYYFWLEAQRRVEAERAFAEAELAEAAAESRRLAEAAAAERDGPDAEPPDVSRVSPPSGARRMLRAVAPGADMETLIAAQVVVAQRFGLAGIDASVAVEDEGLTVEVAEADYLAALPLLVVIGRLRLQPVVTPVEMPQEEIAATIDYVRRRQQSGEWDPASDPHDVARSLGGPVLLETAGLDAPAVLSAAVEEGSVTLHLDEAARARLAEIGLAGRSLAVRFDDLVVHVIAFDGPLEDDGLRLSGLGADEARKIAVLAQAGPLPVALVLDDD